jgi:hypothetical protein
MKYELKLEVPTRSKIMTKYYRLATVFAVTFLFASCRNKSSSSVKTQPTKATKTSACDQHQKQVVEGAKQAGESKQQLNPSFHPCWDALADQTTGTAPTPTPITPIKKQTTPTPAPVPTNGTYSHGQGWEPGYNPANNVNRNNPEICNTDSRITRSAFKAVYDVSCLDHGGDGCVAMDRVPNDIPCRFVYN